MIMIMIMTFFYDSIAIFNVYFEQYTNIILDYIVKFIPNSINFIPVTIDFVTYWANTNIFILCNQLINILSCCIVIAIISYVLEVKMRNNKKYYKIVKYCFMIIIFIFTIYIFIYCILPIEFADIVNKSLQQKYNITSNWLITYDEAGVCPVRWQKALVILITGIIGSFRNSYSIFITSWSIYVKIIVVPLATFFFTVLVRPISDSIMVNQVNIPLTIIDVFFTFNNTLFILTIAVSMYAFLIIVKIVFKWYTRYDIDNNTKGIEVLRVIYEYILSICVFTIILCICTLYIYPFTSHTIMMYNECITNYIQLNNPLQWWVKVININNVIVE